MMAVSDGGCHYKRRLLKAGLLVADNRRGHKHRRLPVVVPVMVAVVVSVGVRRKTQEHGTNPEKQQPMPSEGLVQNSQKTIVFIPQGMCLYCLRKRSESALPRSHLAG